MVLSVFAEGQWCIWESLVFTYQVYDIHAIATGAALKPKCHHVVNCCTNIWVFPIEIWLFWCEERQKELLSLSIVGPGAVGFTKDLRPVVRWEWVPVGIIARRRFLAESALLCQLSSFKDKEDDIYSQSLSRDPLWIHQQ